MSDLLDTSKLGLRKKKKAEMKLVTDPLSKMNSGMKMVVTEYMEQSPMLTPEEAAHIPADLWRKTPEGHPHAMYGKFRCIINGARFFCDSFSSPPCSDCGVENGLLHKKGCSKLPPPAVKAKIDELVKKKGKAGQPSAKAAMRGK